MDDLTMNGLLRRAQVISTIVLILNSAAEANTLQEEISLSNTHDYLIRQAQAYISYLKETNQMPVPESLVREEVLA